MKKIDMKKTLNERAGNTEWTDENTWNVLRKIRNTKAERREYSLRRFVPAFMALLLVAGIGVAALTRTPGSPDPIRDKDLYTAQPIVTALAPGQGEGTDGLPEGDAGKAIREQIRDYYPEIADQLKPINLSSEKDGIRLELISGAVKGDETWAVYSLQDVEGRYPEAVINGYADFDYMMGSVYTGESPLLYADEKEHKYYYCVRAQYHQPVDTNDRMVTFSMPFYEATCTAKLDLLELLKEHGTTGEGILSPELEPVYTAEGEVPRESKKVLDYTKPLDIPVLDNVKLTGIGWIDGSLHIQFHNPDAHGFGDRASTNWGFGMDYDSDYWTEDLFDGASWDENGDGASDWQEEILNCTPETLEKLKPVVNMTVTDNIVDGDWEIRFPLRTICADTVDRMNKFAELQQENPEVYDAVDGFMQSWHREDLSDMYFYSDDSWRTSVNAGWSRLRTLTASGSVVNYNLDSVSGEPGDAERTAVCTVKMELPGEAEPVYRRYELPLRKDQENGTYGVDPTGFSHWEDVKYDQLDQESYLLSRAELPDIIHYGEGGCLLENLSCEKQGIYLFVYSGKVKGNKATFSFSLEDPEGKYVKFPDEPTLDTDIGSVSGSDKGYLYRSEKKHEAFYTQYFYFDQPVPPEERTVTLKMDSVKVYEEDRAYLTPALKKYAKAVEGVEPPPLAQSILKYRPLGPKEVPGLKVLDYSKPMNFPLLWNATLSNIGWIDGKLHIQIHADSPNLGGFDELWLDTSLDGNMDTLWKELDYSPVEWYDDNGSWYEFVYDYAPEDLDKLKINANAIYEAKTLQDDWSVSFPLSQVYVPEEDGTAGLSQDPEEETDDLPEVAAGSEASLLPVNLAREKQGIRVTAIAGLATGNDSYVKYAIQDVDNQYPGLDMEPEKMINTILPEDCDADGTMYPEETTDCDVNAGDAYRNMYIIGNFHSRKIQGEDRAISLGIKDMRLVKRMEIDMHPYIQEYAKQEEGIISKAFGEERKILDPDKKLNIPLGRDDLLLTGIGWIDNQLHVRIKYTGEPLIRNGVSYDNRCNVWISGDYIHPTETKTGVDYSIRTEGGKTGVTVGQLEEILDCGPDNYGDVSLIAHCSVLEDVVQDSWTVSLPLSKICPEIEPAETVSFSAPDTWVKRPLKVNMTLDRQDNLRPQDAVEVTIEVINTSGYDLPGKVTLYDPDGNQLYEMEIAPSEGQVWSGEWTVTEEQLAEGKITFTLGYFNYKEDMQETTKQMLNFSKLITKE